MGDVVALKQGKPRKSQQADLSAAANTPVPKASLWRRLGAMPKACTVAVVRSLGRAAVNLTGALVSVAARVLWRCRREVFVAFGLGALTLLVVLVYQGAHQWRDPKLVGLSIAGVLLFLGLAAIYDALAQGMRKLDYSINGGN